MPKTLIWGLAQDEVVEMVRHVTSSRTHRDDPVLVTMKMLDAADWLVETDTAAVDAD